MSNNFYTTNIPVLNKNIYTIILIYKQYLKLYRCAQQEKKMKTAKIKKNNINKRFFILPIQKGCAHSQ